MNLARFMRFAVVGFSGYLVNAVSLELLRSWPWFAQLFVSFPLGLNQPSAWAAALATEFAILNNFLWNSLWTFQDRAQSGSNSRRFWAFHATSAAAVVIQFLVVGAAVSMWGDHWTVRQIALAVGIATLVVPFNWLMYNRVIWKTGKKPTTP